MPGEPERAHAPPEPGPRLQEGGGSFNWDRALCPSSSDC